MGRGNLRIYLGAAPGVGKTYAMLSEGSRRRDRGTDVAVGFVETHGRRHTIEQIGDLEIVPRRQISYRGQNFEEMDLRAVIARSPEVVLVDEFAHTNVPGVEHEKRWQDVEEILDAGINVITTLNLQHLESVNDVVETITGIVQRETVPDAIVRRADQIELVDMTPEALRRRLAHGNVYPADRVDAALSHFFRPGNLAALRELALLWLADRVDDELAEYRMRHGIQLAWETKERVAVLINGSETSERVIRRASRIAARSKAELVGVTVRSEDGVRRDADGAVTHAVELLEELGGRYIEVVGNDVAKALVAIARSENATQLVIGASRQSRWSQFKSGAIVQRCVREAAGDLDVHVIGTDSHDRPIVQSRRRYRAAPLSMRRIIAAFGLGIVVFPVLTVLLLIDRTAATLPLALSVYLLAVIATAALGGLVPGLVAATAAFVLSNFEFTPPVHKLTIENPRDVAALLVFYVAAVTVSSLVDFAARRSADAVRAQRNARALARMAKLVTEGEGAIASMMDDIVRIFHLDGASLRIEAGSEDSEVVTIGEIGAGSKEISIDRDHRLVISGRDLDPESLDLLQVVISQLVAALDRRRLEVESAERASLKSADELRSTLLTAVSHDLRMPLASIKSTAASLLSQAGACTREQQEQLLKKIDAESERLSRLVEDLLDMSRINEGSVELALSDVDIVKLVDSAIDDAVAATGADRSKVSRTGAMSAMITTDPVLLTRVIYNLVVNSLVHASDGSVSVDIGGVTGELTVRVIDHGRGMRALGDVSQIRPHLRQGAAGTGRGVGFGLAISHGFIKALGGELEVEDTPGGGTTIALVLPVRSTPDAVTVGVG